MHSVLLDISNSVDNRCFCSMQIYFNQGGHRSPLVLCPAPVQDDDGAPAGVVRYPHSFIQARRPCGCKRLWMVWHYNLSAPLNMPGVEWHSLSGPGGHSSQWGSHLLGIWIKGIHFCFPVFLCLFCNPNDCEILSQEATVWSLAIACYS